MSEIARSYSTSLGLDYATIFEADNYVRITSQEMPSLLGSSQALSSEDSLLRPPCEIVVRYVLPAFRSMVAKQLIEEHGFTQVAAAKKLGTTQAAISYYLDAKRGGKRLKQLASNPTIKTAITRVAKGIASNNIKTEDAMTAFCDLCNDLRKQDVICTMHRASVSLPQMCDICPTANRKRP